MRIMALCMVYALLLTVGVMSLAKDPKKDDQTNAPTVYTVDDGDFPTKIKVGDTIRFYRTCPIGQATGIKVEVDGEAKLIGGALSIRYKQGKPVLTDKQEIVYEIKAQKKGKTTVTIRRKFAGEVPLLPEAYEIEIADKE
jgi:hypothetical protein